MRVSYFMSLMHLELLRAGVLCWELCFAFSVASLPSPGEVERAVTCFSCSLSSTERGRYVDVE